MWLWSKADLPKLKDDMERFSDTFTTKHSIKSDVNVMWTEYNDKCIQLMADYIPSKLTSNRFSEPWINRNIKKLSWRKKRAYNKLGYPGKSQIGSSTSSWRKNVRKNPEKLTLHMSMTLYARIRRETQRNFTTLSRARSVMLAGCTSLIQWNQPQWQCKEIKHNKWQVYICFHCWRYHFHPTTESYQSSKCQANFS